MAFLVKAFHEPVGIDSFRDFHTLFVAVTWMVEGSTLFGARHAFPLPFGSALGYLVGAEQLNIQLISVEIQAMLTGLPRINRTCFDNLI